MTTATTTCFRSGKVSYATRAKAQKACDHVKRRDTGEPSYVYRCPHCGEFHFGHRWRNEPYDRNEG